MRRTPSRPALDPKVGRAPAGHPAGVKLKRGALSRSRQSRWPGPKAQGRAVSSRMPEWGSRLVARSPDRCSRGRERIPNFILDGENLWKGDSERRKQRTRASVRVGSRSACGGAAGSVTVARVSVTRGVAAGCAGAGGSPQGSDRSLA
jgi:hypothetical protein